MNAIPETFYEDPRVHVTIEQGHGQVHVDATMLGKPVRIKGAVSHIEVMTDSGRYTLVPMADVEPLNDEAKALLAAEPVKKPEA